MAYSVSVGGVEWPLTKALGWDAGKEKVSPIEVSGGIARIDFVDGVLVARLAVS